MFAPLLVCTYVPVHFFYLAAISTTASWLARVTPGRGTGAATTGGLSRPKGTSPSLDLIS